MTSVRPVGLADLERTVALWEQVLASKEIGGQLPPLPDLLERLRALMRDSERAVTENRPATYRLSIATAGDDRAIGLVSLRVVDAGPLVSAASVVVDVVHVAKEHRRAGVGRALLAEAVCFASSVGADDLSVHVPTGLRDVNRFYANWGFAARTVRRGTSVTSLRRKIGVEARATPPESAADLPQIQRLLRRRAVLGSRLARPARLPR